MDAMLRNVILMGVSLMLIFTAFQTTGIIEQTVISSVKTDDPSFNGDGYLSLAIIYAAFATANWLAPSILSLSGPKYGMIMGAIPYIIFVGCFLKPTTWSLYLTSVLVGIGAAVLWTAQGNYLTLNSNETTMGRNSGIFWAIFQCSMLFGNIFVFYAFDGLSYIEEHTRRLVFLVLLGVSIAGLLLAFLLGTVSHSDAIANEAPLQALKEAPKLLVTQQMFLLCFTFIYTGLELSFFSGVYSTAIGFTLAFGERAKRLVGLSGVFIGVGEIFGGLLFGILGKKTTRYGRDPVVLLGCLVHLGCFYLIFLNLPDDSPFGKTSHLAPIESSTHCDNNYFLLFFFLFHHSANLAMLCSFLLGFGDACFNTQVIALLGILYSENSAPAFAIFKFFQSLAAAACFFYSGSIGLHYQLLILVVTVIGGTYSFWWVDWTRTSPSLEIDSVDDDAGTDVDAQGAQ
ncbi:unnamed protein product [Darwinula stevensoni]|uniref:UNC93-like protein MFSD11 n=1 Tax=Darwinula stevensoni TaxID=69355 RepID=A0A7R8X5I3_9CRUS|nr:unnamed protein product [Darwinula stevensoni]CAG0886646.1 unnamed protein product [Darwinula stevensoni]